MKVRLRNMMSALLIGCAGYLAPTSLSGAHYNITEVMSGLVTPRGLDFGPDGALYVAEAGSGGNGPSVVLGNGATAFLGASSGLSKLQNGVQTRVLSGLPSVANASGGDAGGLQDIAFDGSGQAYGLFSFGSTANQRSANLGPAGAELGTIARLSLDGSGVRTPVADITLHEQNNNPEGTIFDSNPFHFAINSSGNFIVADAGANDFVQATPAGMVSTLAVLPVKPNPLFPLGPPNYQSVPTAIAVGPDNAYYIGQLTGFPFPPGAANVFRYDPLTGTTTVAYSGFTNIIDLTFDSSGNLFVLQVSTNGLTPGAGLSSGKLLKINGLTGERSTIVDAGLSFPGGVAAGPDGSLYVTNRANVPTGGQVLKITPVPEPATWLFMVGAGCVGLAWRVRRKV
ncbi:MAG: ScyD/ScyE family protein [Pirellulales bacterium]|nr:ScyD/ScyE family protein [Pirellulales bacterium]